MKFIFPFILLLPCIGKSQNSNNLVTEIPLQAYSIQINEIGDKPDFDNYQLTNSKNKFSNFKTNQMQENQFLIETWSKIKDRTNPQMLDFIHLIDRTIFSLKNAKQ